MRFYQVLKILIGTSLWLAVGCGHPERPNKNLPPEPGTTGQRSESGAPYTVGGDPRLAQPDPENPSVASRPVTSHPQTRINPDLNQLGPKIQSIKVTRANAQKVIERFGRDYVQIEIKMREQILNFFAPLNGTTGGKLQLNSVTALGASSYMIDAEFTDESDLKSSESFLHLRQLDSRRRTQGEAKIFMRSYEAALTISPPREMFNAENETILRQLTERSFGWVTNIVCVNGPSFYEVHVISSNDPNNPPRDELEKTLGGRRFFSFAGKSVRVGEFGPTHADQLRPGILEPSDVSLVGDAETSDARLFVVLLRGLKDQPMDFAMQVERPGALGTRPRLPVQDSVNNYNITPSSRLNPRQIYPLPAGQQLPPNPRREAVQSGDSAPPEVVTEVAPPARRPPPAAGTPQAKPTERTPPVRGAPVAPPQRVPPAMQAETPRRGWFFEDPKNFAPVLSNGDELARPTISQPMKGFSDKSYLNARFDLPVRYPRVAKVIQDFEQNYDLPSVQYWLKAFNNPNHNHIRGGKRVYPGFYYRIRTALDSAEPFRDLINTIFHAFDVAPPAALLAIVESNFFSEVRKVGGVNQFTYPIQVRKYGNDTGPFQFLPSSARHFGMHAYNNSGGAMPAADDERLYFIPSVCGAAKHFRQSINYFYDVDTTIAILAYNRGDAGATQLISRSNQNFNNALNIIHRYNLTFRQAVLKMVDQKAIDYVSTTLALYFYMGNPALHGLEWQPKGLTAANLPAGKMLPPSRTMKDPACAQAVSSFIQQIP